MSSKAKPRRLSETVVPGVDYSAKVQVGDILNKDVLITDFSKAEGAPEFAKVDPETGELINRDYWNIEIETEKGVFTFSIGAMPVDKVLTALQEKISRGEAELPLLATFRKEGRTYVIE